MFCRAWTSALSRADLPQLLAGELTHDCIIFRDTPPRPPSPVLPSVQLCWLASQRKARNANGYGFADGSSLKISLKQGLGRRQGGVFRDSDSAPIYQIPAVCWVRWHLRRGCGLELESTVMGFCETQLPYLLVVCPGASYITCLRLSLYSLRRQK